MIEFAFSLSEEECCAADDLKRVLKHAYRNEIPAELLYRKKQGFGVPKDYLLNRREGELITVGILKNEWKEI